VRTIGGRFIVGLAILLIGLVVALPASASEGNPERAVGSRPGRWYQLLGAKHEQTRAENWLQIYVEDGYCVGEPHPRYGGTEVIERPKTAYRPFKSAVIRPFVLSPASVSKSQVVPICAGIGWGWEKWIRFKRPLRQLFLYDGLVDPPRRVWPPIGISLEEAWAKVERIERRR
jgi:hypothetical protein